MKPELSHDYSDIIGLPHPTSRAHPPMSMLNRAAQFAPFAALTGYGEAIDETARLTQQRVELGEAELAELNAKLSALKERLPAEADITYFVPDRYKAGGRYVTERFTVRQIRTEIGALALTGGRTIDLDCVIDLEMPGNVDKSSPEP